MANRKSPVLITRLLHTDHACLHLAWVTLSCIVVTQIGEASKSCYGWSIHRQLLENLSCHLRSVSSQVCLHNLQPSPSKSCYGWSIHRQLSKNLSRHLRSVSSQVCLHNFQPSYSKLSRSSYFFQASLFSPSSPNCETVLVVESSLQSENITYSSESKWYS